MTSVWMCVLLLAPLFSAWWLFFPLAFVATFFFMQTGASYTTALLLDSFYFGGTGRLPVLTLFIFVILIVRTSLRDRLRLS